MVELESSKKFVELMRNDPYAFLHSLWLRYTSSQNLQPFIYYFDLNTYLLTSVDCKLQPSGLRQQDCNVQAYVQAIIIVNFHTDYRIQDWLTID